jgi:hypothetical protein
MRAGLFDPEIRPLNRLPARAPSEAIPSPEPACTILSVSIERRLVQSPSVRHPNRGSFASHLQGVA